MAAFDFPASPVINQTYQGYVWDGATWLRQGSAPQQWWLNPQVITQNISIPAGFNGMAAGPIEIGSGVTLDIATGSTWTVV